MTAQGQVTGLLTARLRRKTILMVRWPRRAAVWHVLVPGLAVLVVMALLGAEADAVADADAQEDIFGMDAGALVLLSV